MRRTLLALTLFLSSFTWSGRVKAVIPLHTAVDVNGESAKCTFRFEGGAIYQPDECTSSILWSDSWTLHCPGLKSPTLCNYCKGYKGSFYEPKDALKPKFHGGNHDCPKG